MRCLVLAEVLSSRGWEVYFSCLPQPGDLIAFIEQTGFSVINLTPPLILKEPRFDGDYESWVHRSELEDASNFIEVIESTDWVVVDHYGLGEQWETQVTQNLGCSILAIDDLNRTHDCQLILDQNYWPEMESRYSSSTSIKLLGPKYALLRPRFRELKRSSPKKQNQIVAFFGGTDPTEECKKLLEAASKIASLPFIIKVVTGRLNQKYYELLKYAEFSHIEIVQFLQDFECELARSKYAIGASGVSNWERFCLNIPATIVSVADNQRILSQFLSQQDLVSYLGEGRETTSDTYYEELRRLEKVWYSIQPFSKLEVDGYGAKRVATSMESN